MPLPAKPIFSSGKFLTVAQLNALEAAIPSTLTDLVPSPTGSGQVLTSSTDGFVWASLDTESPVFTGPTTIAKDSYNYFVLNGGAINNAPAITTSGSDIDIGLSVKTSGLGPVTFSSNNSIGGLQIFPLAPNNPSGNILLQAAGSSSAIGIQLVPKGTAYVSLVASPPASDNSNNVATTGFVNSYFNALVASGTVNSGGGTGTGGTGTGGTGTTPPFGYGTFTPTFSPSSFVTGSGSGNYWLAGNMLFFEFTITVTGLNPNGMGTDIVGLPIPVAALASDIGIRNLSVQANFVSIALTAVLVKNTISIMQQGTAGSAELLVFGASPGMLFGVSGVYPVDR